MKEIGFADGAAIVKILLYEAGKRRMLSIQRNPDAPRGDSTSLMSVDDLIKSTTGCVPIANQDELERLVRAS